MLPIDVVLVLVVVLVLMDKLYKQTINRQWVLSICYIFVGKLKHMHDDDNISTKQNEDSKFGQSVLFDISSSFLLNFCCEHLGEILGSHKLMQESFLLMHVVNV